MHPQFLYMFSFFSVISSFLRIIFVFRLVLPIYKEDFYLVECCNYIYFLSLTLLDNSSTNHSSVLSFLIFHSLQIFQYFSLCYFISPLFLVQMTAHMEKIPKLLLKLCLQSPIIIWKIGRPIVVYKKGKW